MKKHTVTITLDKELQPVLKDECITTNRSKSALINYILNKYFNAKRGE